MKNILKDLPHYSILLGVLVAGFIAFALFSYDKGFQIAVAVAVAVSYVVWGIIHHSIHKDLYLEVVIEYIIVASLGLVVVLSLLLRE